MGKEINRNKTYVTEDCKNRCVCMGNNIFECGLLCPPDEKPECGSDETMVTDRLSQDDTSCRCAQSRCAENSKFSSLFHFAIKTIAITKPLF